MKTYPKINDKELSQEQKEIFDMIEEQILWNSKQIPEGKNSIDVLAYNSAFIIISDNRFIISKK